MLNLGLIGYGEAGYYLTSEFKEDTVKVYAFDVVATQGGEKAELIKSRAKANSVTLVDTAKELFEKSDVIFCLTSAGSAVPVAGIIKEFLTEGKIYIDLNSTSPQTKAEINNVLAGAAGTYLEGAVMSAVPAKKTQVPINICGPDSEAVATMLNETGMNVHSHQGEIGSASALKMFKSVLSKGMIALITETVFCTKKYGLTEMVLHDLINTINMMSFDGFCNYVVTQASVHHARLAREMDEVVKTLESIDENAIMTKAVKEKFEWMTEMDFASHFEERPNTYDEVVAVKREMEGR